MRDLAKKIVRSLRQIDADLLDIKEMDAWKERDATPEFRALSRRLSFAIDELENAFLDNEVAELWSKRWEVLFETPGIRVAQTPSNKWALYMDYIGRDGSITGCKFLFREDTLQALADRYLGLTG